MKTSRWWVLAAVAVLILCVWWALRRIPERFDADAAASPSADVDRAAPTAASESDGGGRESVRSTREPSLDPSAKRTLHLELLRFPDEAPLATVQVEIAPIVAASASTWVLTDSTGHVDVEVLAGTIELGVHAAGYEPRAVQIEGAAAQLRVLLTPSSGLFGRVVDSEQAPIADAQVRLEVSQRIVQNVQLVTRSAPEVGVAERPAIAATSTTNRAGYYCLAYPTTTSTERVHLVATANDAGGALDVQLPRATTQLDDISVSRQRSMTIRVVDTSGAPVAGATVRGTASPRRDPELRTGSDGTVKLIVPTLPAVFVASAAGMRQREQRHDDRVVARGAQVQSFETRVELVLESVPSLSIKVLDAETRQPIFLARGRVDLMRDGREAASNPFQPDSRGEATVLLIDESGEGGSTQGFDVARVSASANDYREDPPTDIDLRAPLSTAPIELLLQPDAGTVTLHGRVVRAGEPIAGVQVGVKVQRRSEGAKPHGWEYKRVYTDADGRFSARWSRKNADQVVSAYPHWQHWDEFGFIGPLDVDVAIASEQVLELKPAIRVPAILRGVSKGGRYLYFVSVVDGDVAINTTINGAPLAVDVDGEARVTMLLPSVGRARVSVGYSTGSSYYDNVANAIEFDPAQHSTLVFDLQPLFAAISGRAVSFTTDEIARLSVTFVAQNDQQSRAVRCNADGTFHIGSVSRGSGDLLLILDGPTPYQANVLARMPLVLQGDVENLQLTRDPTSLPETPTERR
jgi:hypothetical protein